MNEHMTTGVVTEHALTWLAPAPGLVALLGAAAIVVALWLARRPLRQVSPGVRAGLLGLRGAALAIVVLVALEPALREQVSVPLANRVVIATDVSQSMASAMAGRAVRASDARTVLEAAAKDALGEARVRVEHVRFAKNAVSVAAGASDARPDAQATDLGAALASVAPDAPGSPLSAVVLVTDGRDTTGTRPEALAAQAARLGAPVHAVWVTGAGETKDVAVATGVVDAFAFVRNTVTLPVRITARGYAGREVNVTLLEDGQPLQTQTARLPPGGEETTLNLKFEPSRAGQRVYSVVLPVLPGEQVAENNRVDVSLKVIRDRLRVLLVAGRPSWDERYLRQLLKENPSVDLVSFFILRTTDDVTGAPSDELSLIPFPTRQLFTEELHTFDIVIFHDFNYAPYQMATYLDDVQAFVREAGGGFMMVGGSQSFAEGGYAGTPIADILPVALPRGTGHLNTNRFVPRLTDAGARHPVTDLSSVLGSRSFADLLPLEGVNTVLGLTEGATTLLEHPHLNAGRAAAPVLAVREVGKGRSLALMTDSTWFWSLPQAADNQLGADVHRRLLANALRWLVKDPELSRVRLDVPRAVEPGAPVDVAVTTLDARYAPAGGHNVELRVRAMADGAEVAEKRATTPKGGRATLALGTLPPGVYRVRATATKDGRFIGTDEDVLAVQARSAELVHIDPTDEALRAIAEATGGRVVTPNQAGDLPFVDRERVRALRQETKPIWRTPWAWVCVFVLLGAEWWWRRRVGLV